MIRIRARSLKEAKKKVVDKKGIFVKLSSGHLVQRRKNGLNTYEFEMKKSPRRSGNVLVVEPNRYHGESKNKHMDELRPALPPGKRVSKNGKIYYETRANHSDWPETIRAKGKKKKNKKRRR